jgi:maleylacetoacetate isomerase
MRELHDFHRSSSAHRVRIALALKGLDYKAVPVALQDGEHLEAEYRTVNPQGLVPVYSDAQIMLSQSLAIIEYLDETHPTPPLLPGSALERARARQFALLVAADMQPLTGLRVMSYLRDECRMDVAARRRWFHHWLMEGLDALELWLTAAERATRYCVSDEPSIADVCLVPQLEVARRSGIDLDEFPRLAKVEAQCMALEAFQRARAAPGPAAS